MLAHTIKAYWGWPYRSALSPPRHKIEASGELQVSAALPQGKETSVWVDAVLELPTKSPAFHETQRFMTTCTARHQTIWLQPTPSQPISLRSILTPPSHPRLGLPKSLLFKVLDYICLCPYHLPHAQDVCWPRQCPRPCLYHPKNVTQFTVGLKHPNIRLPRHTPCMMCRKLQM